MGFARKDSTRFVFCFVFVFFLSLGLLFLKNILVSLALELECCAGASARPKKRVVVTRLVFLPCAEGDMGTTVVL